jgi:crotonobetainyl-CoA:carnitine CoA-transferase CaiB-like acyl-CoA transferase
MSSSPPTKPLLSSVRILELGHFIAAPFATRVLADLGADVIKIEPPGSGDPVRGWGARVNGRSIWWSVHGRNKRSVTLNLRDPSARKILLQLVAQCDAVVENFRPRQLEKWGIGPEVLAKARPGLTIVRISGYGQNGPEASKASFGVIGEAKGGLRYLTGYPKGTTDLPPPRTGVSVGDSVAGLYGALGTLAAIIEQRASGRREPRLIDVALGEAVLSLMEGILPEYALTGAIREPMGSGMTSSAPTSAYPCKGGAWVLIAANSDPLFRTLAGAMGEPGLADDARFKDNPSRLANVAELDRLIGLWTATLDIDEVLARLEAANIPASKVYTVADIAADPQYRARRMVTEVEDPAFGRLLQPGVVPVVEGLDRDSQIRWPGPEVGAHNTEVYQGLLGMGDAEIEALTSKGLI